MRDKRRIQEKVRRHIYKRARIYILAFPILVVAIYLIPCLKRLPISAGELLAYYGVIFGLLGSYYKYSEDRRKEKREKEKKLTPALTVELKRESAEEFHVSIVSVRDLILRDVYLYDEFLCETMSKGKIIEKSVGFCLNKTECEGKQLDYNITMDSEILDKDGYPQYVQIVCDDIEGNSWVCDFNKIDTSGKKVYRQVSAWIT